MTREVKVIATKLDSPGLSAGAPGRRKKPTPIVAAEFQDFLFCMFWGSELKFSCL